jgi:hypothetical protein
MKRFTAAIVTLTAGMALFGPTQATASNGDDEGLGGTPGGFELTTFYGASFLDARTWGWPEQRLGGSFVQGLAFGRRLGGHVLAEVAFAIAPGRKMAQRYSSYPEYAVDARASMPCLPFAEGSGSTSSGCYIPPNEYTDSTRVVSYEYGASIAVDLGGRSTRPFLSAGVGAVTYAFEHDTDTDLRLSFGAGIRRTFGRLGARLELIDFVSPDAVVSGEVEHDVQIRVGLQLRLP